MYESLIVGCHNVCLYKCELNELAAGYTCIDLAGKINLVRRIKAHVPSPAM